MCCIILADLGWLWRLPQWSVPCHSMITAAWSLMSLQSPVSGCFEIFFCCCINFLCVTWYLYCYVRKMIAFVPDIPFSIILNFLCGFPCVMLMRVVAVGNRKLGKMDGWMDPPDGWVHWESLCTANLWCETVRKYTRGRRRNKELEGLRDCCHPAGH